MEVSYTNLVGPRGEKLEPTKPFWSFSLFTSEREVHMSFPRELSTYGGYTKGGSMDSGHQCYLIWQKIARFRSLFIPKYLPAGKYQ
jgi:hypothetical protein